MPETAVLHEVSPAAERSTDEAHPLRVLFVCTGNTCRSPMAEAVARHLLEERRLALPELLRELTVPEFEVSSAGLYAAEGEPITENACKALEAAGIEPLPPRDYRAHRAHRLTAEDAACCDLLVGMTPEHALELMMRFPQIASRVRTMPRPIPDPFGGDEAVYRASLAAITDGVKELLFSAPSDAPSGGEGATNG